MCCHGVEKAEARWMGPQKLGSGAGRAITSPFSRAPVSLFAHAARPSAARSGGGVIRSGPVHRHGGAGSASAAIVRGVIPSCRTIFALWETGGRALRPQAKRPCTRALRRRRQSRSISNLHARSRPGISSVQIRRRFGEARRTTVPSRIGHWYRTYAVPWNGAVSERRDACRANVLARWLNR